MADILIRGMEMPKSCGILCINIFHDGKVTRQFDLSCEQIATAVPLPEGHGRLVDADAPVRVVYNDGTIHSTTVSRLLCQHSLLDLPKTIVPAEGGGEECSEN